MALSGIPRGVGLWLLLTLFTPLATAAEVDTQRFVEQVSNRLTPAEIDDLHRGDAKVLDRITPNALEQLQLARAYLEARDVHANDPAVDRVLERIVAERHGEDLRHSLSHGEKGITHG